MLLTPESVTPEWRSAKIEIKLLHPASTEEVTDSGDREGRQERVKASYVFERRSNARGKGTDD
ncbi:MAG: hypothetical protein P8X89_00025 [Reinekea sp.]